MKKIILLLIILSIFISGCGSELTPIVAGTVAHNTSSAETAATAATTAAPTTTLPATSLIVTSETAVNTHDEKQNAPTVSLRDLKIHYLDVGQSDCIFIELPTGENILIDAGNNASEQKIIDYLEALEIEQIDYVFATHPHEDHIGALDSILKSYKIINFYLPAVTNNTNDFYRVINALITGRLNMTIPKSGDLIINDSENHLYLRVLAPAKDEYIDLNNYSFILKLAYCHNIAYIARRINSSL